MQSRYYETASRYTTSAFMRLKLGAGLKDRDVAPHVFETRQEAHAAADRLIPSVLRVHIQRTVSQVSRSGFQKLNRDLA